MGNPSMLMLIAAVGAVLMGAANAGEDRPFAGFRALVVAPGEVWQEWDSAVFGALEERGFAVTYVRDLDGGLEDFDLVVVNAERALTDAQQGALTDYVAGGGAVYASFDQPYAWGRGADLGGPAFMRDVCRVGGARAQRVSEVILAEEADAVPIRRHVGCFEGTDEGWAAVSLQALPGGTPAFTDGPGNALGILAEHGTGRTAVMGLPPEQDKYLARPEVARRTLDRTLAWLLERAIESGPRAWSNAVHVAVPARAEVVSVHVNGERVADPVVRRVGSLRKVTVDVADVEPGAELDVRVAYKPLGDDANVETMIHHPWGVLVGAAESPADMAAYVESLGATVCHPLLRASNGTAWYRGMPEDRHNDMLVTDYDGDFLADLIAECHTRGIRLSAGLYLDNSTPTRTYPEVRRVQRDGTMKQDRYGNYSACFNNPKGQEHQLATFEHLLANYDVDEIMLDDNYWLGYSDMYTCYCDYCKDAFRRYCEAAGIEYADPSTLYGERADTWWAHKREETLRLTARIRRIANAHGVPAGGWVSCGMGMTYLAESFDVIGEMVYNSHPRAMRGPLSLIGETELVCLVWEEHVDAAALEEEIRQAVRAGCSTVGVWTGKVAVDYKAPPEKEAAIRRAFGAVETEWLRYYRENVLAGDARFALTTGTVGAREAVFRITNTGAVAVDRVQGELDLSALE